jgi:hypothetical protein
MEIQSENTCTTTDDRVIFVKLRGFSKMSVVFGAVGEGTTSEGTIVRAACLSESGARPSERPISITTGTSSRDPREEDFWNLAHEARIRVFLERLVYNSTWFSRSAEKRGVTKEVIIGTVNRVWRCCSNNPKFMAIAANRDDMAKTALVETGRTKNGLSTSADGPEPHTSPMSSFHNSGRAAMKSRISWMHSSLSTTVSSMPREAV